MNIVIAVSIQILILGLIVYRFKRDSIGKIGFLMMAYTFVYHGLTEIIQAIFPGRNPYTEFVSASDVAQFVTLVTGVMVAFTCTYLIKIKVTHAPRRYKSLVLELDKDYFLKTAVLLALSAPAFLLFALSKKADSSDYWGAGLTDQFLPYLLSLALATMVIKSSGRNFLIYSLPFMALISAAGGRSEVFNTLIITISAMTRYGLRVTRRQYVIGGAMVACLFILISNSRSNYGRFQGEGLVDRIKVIAQSATSGIVSGDYLLDDFVYRFDGNSYGGLILSHQSDGYGITGLDQLVATIGYMIPSFINKSKLALDVSLRNEESYHIAFYSLTDIDYLSDFWTLTLGYTGPILLIVLAGGLGFATALIDNWLAASTSSNSYIAGVMFSSVPTNLETSGPALLLYTFRALAVILLVSTTLRRGRSLSRTLPEPAFRFR